VCILQYIVHIVCILQYI